MIIIILVCLNSYLLWTAYVSNVWLIMPHIELNHMKQKNALVSFLRKLTLLFVFVNEMCWYLQCRIYLCYYNSFLSIPYNLFYNCYNLTHVIVDIVQGNDPIRSNRYWNKILLLFSSLKIKLQVFWTIHKSQSSTPPTLQLV